MGKVANSFISILLTVSLIFGFTPTVAWAENQNTSGDQSSSIESSKSNNMDSSLGDASDSNHEDSSNTTTSDKEGSSTNNSGGNADSSYDGPKTDASDSSPEVLLLDDSTEKTEEEINAQLDALASQYKNSLKEGTYYISTALNEAKNLDVASASKANGAKVQLYQINMTEAQQWKVTYDSIGYATITNAASGKVLDVASANTSNGTKIQQYSSNNSRAQKWIIVPSENGSSYTIYSALGENIVLDVANGSTSNGTKIQIYASNGTQAQSWVFDEADASYDELDARANASKGLLNTDDVYYIETALASNKVVDIASASKNNGANAQIYDFNKTDAQKYRISYDATGYVTFTNVSSGKVLDVANASTVPGANVQQYAANNSRAQKWIVEKNEDGTYSISSALWQKLSLDVSGASAANKANVQVYRTNGSTAQKWNFISENELYASLDARASASKGILDTNDTYYIETALAKNKVLDIASASKNNGANAQLYDFNMSTAQQYRVSYDETGYVTFTNVGSGKVLDVESGTAESGANVQQYASNDSRAQKWIVEKNDNGTYTITSALWDGLVLDVKSASTTNKTNVQIYQSNNSIAQQWNFISENELYASLDARALQNKDVLPDGTYVISSDTDNSKVVDVTSGSKADGANIQMWEANMSEAQQWIVTHDEKGYVTFKNLGSGKVLDVESGAAKSGTNVQQYASNDSRGQKWIVEQNSDGAYTLTSAVWDSLVLDIQSGDPKNGSNVQIYTSNQTSAQKFDFYNANPEVDPCENQNFGDGYFSIKTALNESYVVDVLSGLMSDGANVQMYSSNKSYAQLYSLKFIPDGLFSSTGYYQIICACSDMAIAVDHGNVVDGSNVVQHTANAGDDSQLFSVKANGDGTYTFINKASGLALDVANNDVVNGTNLQGFTPNNQIKQRFVISEVKDYLPEGYVVISSKLKSSMVVDVASGSLSDGANVQLYSDNGTQAQKWYVSLVEEGSNTYTIQSINSGMNLAVTSNGNVVQKTPDNSDSQKWQPRISKGSTILMNVETGKVLDIASAGTSNGVNVQTYAANGTSAQLFVFSSTDLVTKSTYYIKPLSASSMAIDVPSNSSANGTKVQIYSRNDTGAQKWKVSKNSDGTYSIKNAQSGKALELSGTSVQINSSNNSAAQKWIFTYCTGGGITITSSANPSMALTVSNGNFAASSSVVGAANQGLNTQKFTFEKTMYIPANVPSNFRAMYTKAYSNSSSTDWLIMVDRANHLLGVFQGSKENWNLVKALRCTTGKWSTPTPAGVTITTNKYYYHSQSYWRTVIFNGMYGIHSTISGDWELGRSISNGCIRINRNEAIWLYNTVPLGTAVIVY